MTNAESQSRGLISTLRADHFRSDIMPKGSKSKYSSKQKRKAEHIAEGYEKRGVSEKTAKARAWATVNKESGGGKKSGSGHGRQESHASSRKGGHKGGKH
jgi:plasmid stabilization system protein ParE